MTDAPNSFLQTKTPDPPASPNPSGSTDASRAFRCPHDGAPCEVVSRFEAVLPDEDRSRLYKLVDRYLPCNSCRAVDATAKTLRGVRLGRTERFVLLHAAPTTEKSGRIVAPADRTRAARESALRAARKLYELRLLEISHEDVRIAGERGTRSARFRVAWRSPLADEIVRRFRKELESGARIRWGKRLEEGARAARRDIIFLLRALHDALEVAHMRQAQLAGFVIAVGNVQGAQAHGQRAADTHTLLVAVRDALRAASGPEATGGR